MYINDFFLISHILIINLIKKGGGMMYDQKLYYRYLISLGIVIFVFIFYLKGGKFDPLFC
ncbi:hypothetical protein BCJMU39_4859 [Bacillus cereus]|nr:hypothetical protein BCJMU39_4859 [Bacillus cereus]BCD14440.1 hypothetical protein BC30075_5357 [Bacillus cereus]BCD20105.1 hypothetical protein BC30077_4881 [Bacillus cereus]